MISCIFDLFYPHPPKPTFDLFLTYFNVFGVSGGREGGVREGGVAANLRRVLRRGSEKGVTPEGA